MDMLLSLSVTKPIEVIYKDIGRTYECEAYLTVKSQHKGGDYVRIRLMTRNGPTAEAAAQAMERDLEEIVDGLEWDYVDADGAIGW